MSVVPQRSYKREIFVAECALAEIIEDILDFLIPLEDEKRPHECPETAVTLYQRLIDWKLSLPDSIRAEKAIVTAGILLHNMMGTIWTFRALYTVRNEFWFAHLLAVCAFRVLYDLDSGPIQVDTFVKACQALYELGGRFHIARDALSSLQSVLTQRNLQVPSYATGYMRIETECNTPSVMRCTVVPVGSEKGHQSRADGSTHLRISDIIAMTDEGTSID
ncbi:iron sulfur cluster assembly protein [Purpureocillium lavendulum]|uniref:Iron sulfur cluster assembly protein n=1 Tax=Purpureocillium lavendulum TaxID=1247861 RepID=A0AB34G2H3_9HYPO|nr:iron sulfur cluster assembly protein [Purpureocillium lavendulum]